jgi:hypothetical protein
VEDKTQTKGKSLSLHKRNLLENVAKAEALSRATAQPNAAAIVQGTITMAAAMDAADTSRFALLAGIGRVIPGIAVETDGSPSIFGNRLDVG